MSEPVGRPVAAVMFVLTAGIAAAADDPHELGDLDVEQLMGLRVVTASKHSQRATQAPASVTVVTRADIERAGYRTLAEILAGVRGFYVANDRQYSYIGTRGFLRPGDYNGRILVLLDGHRMNEDIYDGGYVAHEAMVGVDLVERVEVIRGPASSVYGNNAVLAVINVITRRPADVDGLELSGGAGSRRSYEAQLSYGGLPGGLATAASITGWSSRGQDRAYYPEFDPAVSSEPRAANGGVAEDADDERAWNGYASMAAGDWTLRLFAATRDKRQPTAAYGTVFGDERLLFTDQRAYADLAWQHAIQPDTQLDLRMAYDWYGFDGDYPVDQAAAGDPPDIIINVDQSRGQWLTTEVQATHRLGGDDALVAGIEYRDHFQQDQLNYDAPAPDTPYVDARETSRTVGAYAQADFALWGALRASAGLRYDTFFGDFDEALSPRAGLIADLATGTTLKALYGSAYRAPNIYERFYYSAQAGQPRLEPETIRTYEVVAEQHVGRNHHLSVSGYRYDLHGLITQTTDAAGDVVFRNLAAAEGYGVELEAAGKWNGGFEVVASLLLQKTRDGTTGQELSSSPGTLAKVRLVLPLAGDRLGAVLEGRYHDSMSTLRGGGVDGALVGNAHLLWRAVVPGLDVSLGATNVGDVAYGFSGSEDHTQRFIPEDGRRLLFRARYGF